MVIVNLDKDFKYIREYYNVPAEYGREVMIGDSKGVITKDMGNYIGVVLYDNVKNNKDALPYHPTHEITYLDSFNKKPPKNKKSRQRYLDFLEADWFDGTFGDWIKSKEYKLK